MKETRKQLSEISKGLLVEEPDSREVPLHFLPGLYNTFIRCPQCGSTDFSALQGEDIRVRRVVLD
jgi:hypothetical protein